MTDSGATGAAKLPPPNQDQDNSSTTDTEDTRSGLIVERGPKGGLLGYPNKAGTENGAKTPAAANKVPPPVPESPRVRNLLKLIDRECLFDVGMDSDAEIGPFYDAIEGEGDQLFDEDLLPEKTAIDIAVAAATAPEGADEMNDEEAKEEEPPPPSMMHELIPAERIKGMTTLELKEELHVRGLKKIGNKKALVGRLKLALEQKKIVCKPRPVTKQKKKKKKDGQNMMAAFPPTAYWRVLEPMSEVVPEPANPTFDKPRAPTVPEEDGEFIPLKHNFAEKFDRPVWQGKLKKLIKEKSKKRTRSAAHTFELKEKIEVREVGTVDPEFIKKHGLTVDTPPHAYANLLLPLTENKIDGKEWLSFEQLARWTNLKANLAGAGKDGGVCYEDFTIFSPEEIRRHLGLYVLQGLSPSPEIELKFKPQRVDPIHGKDFVYNAFGANAHRRHKHFKAFFACCNPQQETPDKKKFPNWKIRPLIKWMNFIFPLIWLLSRSFSVDEMTIGFQGKHRDKRRITYKAEGDGFQADALCDNGYTYQVYLRNEPAPPKYLSQGLSPLHSRVMGLFDTLKDDYHHCAMDNLFNSTAFCKAAFNHPRKVMCHGVTRKGARGIPNSVLQDEKQSRLAQIHARGTVKAAVLEGDPDCVNLVASSVYDSKPVHYLSMICEEIKWTQVKKAVYNVDTGRTEALNFLRLNQIDTYNHEMGDVDQADQLRGSYRLDNWVRNRKWWWSLFLWGIGTILTNAYKMKHAVDRYLGVHPNNRISHRDFRTDVCMHWICGDSHNLGDITEEQEKEESEAMPEAVPLEDFTIARRKTELSPLTASTLAAAVRKKPLKTSQRITDATLDPTSPFLRVRLDRTLDHFPERQKIPKARCGIHRWVGYDSQASILHCATCNVNLCIDCFKIFHTIHDIVRQKTALRNAYAKDT